MSSKSTDDDDEHDVEKSLKIVVVKLAARSVLVGTTLSFPGTTTGAVMEFLRRSGGSGVGVMSGESISRMLRG